jgi:hypothetical protein
LFQEGEESKASSTFASEVVLSDKHFVGHLTVFGHEYKYSEEDVEETSNVSQNVKHSNVFYITGVGFLIALDCK